MARPLKGTLKPIDGGFRVELPTAKGAKTRTSYDFTDHGAAEQWRAAGVLALNSGAPLPTPAEGQLLRISCLPRPTGTRFVAMGEAWTRERYQELRRGGLSREISVEAHVRTIDRWMHEQGLVMETMLREPVKALSLFLARAGAPQVPQLPAGVDPDRLVTMDEAVALPSTPSESTLKRRAKDGQLVKLHGADGRVRFRAGDLYTAQVGGGQTMRRGPKRQHGYDQKVVQDVMWVYDQVCLYAQDMGVAVPQDRASLVLPTSDRPASRQAQVVDYATCRAMAEGMHVVHQSVLWTLRVLGVRIGEAYGPRVGDLLDFGPGAPGVLRIAEQGGKSMPERETTTGARTTVPSKKGLKTKGSYRVIAVPPALMDLYRVVIDVFHTDADGTVRTNARLIPALRRQDEAGQGSFRRALRQQAAAVGVTLGHGEDEEELFFRPHDMRYTLISELTWNKVEKAFRMRQVGHDTGDDVHSRYHLDDPRLETTREVAQVIQDVIETEMPAGLLVPTLMRCTTGNQPLLRSSAARIDAALTEAGWLVLPGNADDPLLTSRQVAQELGCTEQTARKYLRTGVLSAVVVESAWAGGRQRLASLSEVQRFKESSRGHISITALADELQVPYSTVYQHLQALGVALAPTRTRELAVPADTAEQVRHNYRAKKALQARAVPLAVAAGELGTVLAQVRALVASGVLHEDERLPDGSRTVTRNSLAVALAERRPAIRRGTRGARPALLPWDEARRVTRLTETQMRTYAADGTFTVVEHNRRRHVERVGVLVWLATHAPDRLVAAAV